MIELVFVIVVLGILAALAIPRLERDLRQEAVDNVLSAVRYTQHLALMDDKISPTDNSWQETLWKITFTSGSNAYYTISSDTDKNGAVSKTECTIDPANGKYMYNSNGAFSGIGTDESPNIFLAHNYGINSIVPSGGCTSSQIAFDHYGRPHVGFPVNSLGGSLGTNDYHSYMNSDCSLTFSFTDTTLTSFTLVITRETGYAYIVGQEKL